jgi:hypothetical protein
LKRAEQDCQDRGSKTKVSLNVRETLNSENQRQWAGFWMPDGRIVSVLCVILVVWAAGYLVFVRNDPGPRPLSRETLSPPTVPAPTESYHATTGGRQIVDKAPAPVPAPTPIPASVQAPVHGLIPVPASVPGITPAGPPISRTDVTEEITETINEEITETVKEDLSKEDPENISLPSPAPREILPLKGGILKIQAISWARDPADRIVVINSKILEQGESIQGYRLVQIKEETVILDHSGQEYELAFDYR